MKVLVFQEKKSELNSGSGFEKIPAIETSPRAIHIPRKDFDFVLITSARATESLKSWPKAKTYLAIGEKTARSLLACPFPVKILNNSTSQGVLEFFKRQKPSSVFFPRSARGNPETVTKLRKMGHRIFVRHAYETRLLDLKKCRSKIFDPKVKAFFCTSPSTVQALIKSFGVKALRARKVQWVAIGLTTTVYVRQRLKIKGVITAKKPDFESMKRAFLTSR